MTERKTYTDDHEKNSPNINIYKAKTSKTNLHWKYFCSNDIFVVVLVLAHDFSSCALGSIGI